MSNISDLLKAMRDLQDPEIQLEKHTQILQTILQKAEPLIKAANNCEEFKLKLKKLSISNESSDEKIKTIKAEILTHQSSWYGFNPIQEVQSNFNKLSEEDPDMSDVYSHSYNKFYKLFSDAFTQTKELCKNVGQIISDKSIDTSEKVSSIQDLLIVVD